MKARLTERQAQVLRLVCEGKTSREIGKLLKISQRTVDVHRKDIRQRVRVSTVPDLVRWAMREKLIAKP